MARRVRAYAKRRGSRHECARMARVAISLLLSLYTDSPVTGAMLSPKVGAPGQWSGLFWTLIRTDFKTRYHGSVGGFIWALLKPLAMFVVLVSVFSFVFATDPTYRLNLVLGIFLFDFF